MMLLFWPIQIANFNDKHHFKLFNNIEKVSKILFRIDIDLSLSF